MRRPGSKQLTGSEERGANMRAAGQIGRALDGLTQRQRMLVNAHLPPPAYNRGSEREGWSVYREPTTINPPTTLRLHKRNRMGKLVEVISITEKGITK